MRLFRVELTFIQRGDYGSIILPRGDYGFIIIPRGDYGFIILPGVILNLERDK